jgi:hypothetical protein
VQVSYWVYLNGPDGSAVTVKPHEEGGTICVGGEPTATLNVTYNYGEPYGVAGFSLRDLQGKTARDVTPELERVVALLGTRRYKADYWAPTPGNAGHALNILLGWAKQHPDAMFEVS